MKRDTRCEICGESVKPAGLHLHEVRVHKKPQRTSEGRNVPSPWDESGAGGREEITVKSAEWVALWAMIDRLRGAAREGA